MIKLRNFNLEKIDKIKHYNLLMRLNRDKSINNYISHNFISFLDKHAAESDDKMEIGKSYVVNKDKKNIGVVGTLNMSSTGVVEVWYSIDKDLRGKGYGEKVLAQVTPYLIENIKGLNDIELKIDKNNKTTAKIIKNILHKNDNECIIMQEKAANRKQKILYYPKELYYDKNKLVY